MFAAPRTRAMPQDSKLPQTIAPQDLFGTHQGLFYLLGVDPVRPRGDSAPRPAFRPTSGLAQAQAALTRAAMADMFCFKGD